MSRRLTQLAKVVLCVHVSDSGSVTLSFGLFSGTSRLGSPSFSSRYKRSSVSLRTMSGVLNPSSRKAATSLLKLSPRSFSKDCSASSSRWVAVRLLVGTRQKNLKCPYLRAAATTHHRCQSTTQQPTRLATWCDRVGRRGVTSLWGGGLRRGSACLTEPAEGPRARARSSHSGCAEAGKGAEDCPQHRSVPATA